MPRLNVNIDLVARLRELRRTPYPDLLIAAEIVEKAGADGITVHLRQDRRHIQDADLPALRRHVKTRLNCELANTDEMIGIALDVKPQMVTLVPESPGEVTTQGGLNVVANEASVGKTADRLKAAGIHVSIFIDPEESQIDASKRCGAESVELCTAAYADAKLAELQYAEFEKIARCARYTASIGMKVNVGHGLDYQNTALLATLSEVEDFNTGHAIIIRAIFDGLQKAVADMVKLVRGGQA
ncbi:MAG TPA: pyridoxine 5'-phosphate synthase [Planctomycetota bacterium]|nr:pyridoxine 5'-phosphate synthase [Planctomycetota bacterium]